MKKRYKFIILMLLFINIALFFWLLIRGHNITLFNPHGMIALQERNLIIMSVSIMFLIVISAVILTFFIAWKYKEGNKKEKYVPDADHSVAYEVSMWVIPGIIIMALAFITWKATHLLDPYKPLHSNVKPLTIQVVAVRWKWLFIYPEQHIATVNVIQFPVHTPIHFELTADAPMSSFWIPSLGGQMYAMTGMVTQHHLIADTSGVYLGSSAEINGPGFSGMKFIAKASSQSDFDAWVQSVKKSPKTLTLSGYNTLAMPSENNPTVVYSATEEHLYTKIVMKYMTPNAKMENMDTMNVKNRK